MGVRAAGRQLLATGCLLTTSYWLPTYHLQLLLTTDYGLRAPFVWPSTTGHTLRTMHYALRTTHHAPRTTHYALRTTHHAPRTTHYAPRTTHYALRTTHYAPRTTHHAPRTTHHALRTTHYWQAADFGAVPFCCDHGANVPIVATLLPRPDGDGVHLYASGTQEGDTWAILMTATASILTEATNCCFTYLLWRPLTRVGHAGGPSY